MLPSKEVCKSILSKAENKKLLVVGDIMLDHYIWGDATRISPEAPVPVVSVYKDNHVAGGAANVALNLSHLGTKNTSICGWIGKDESGKKLLDILTKNQITIPDSFVSESITTILKARVMVQTQQLCRIDREQPIAHYKVSKTVAMDQLLEKVDSADGIILSDYGKGVIDDEIIKEIRSLADHNKTLLSMDPKPRRSLDFCDMDIMTPNRSEALELAGIQCGPHDSFPKEEVCELIWEKYKPRALLITLGSEGMLVCKDGKVQDQISTMAREVFDVSGAGDTVISALTLALTTGADLVDAARFANLCAGIVVAKIGTATLQPREIFQALEHE